MLVGREAGQKVICCGNLEKRRDGAVRGGWARRTFVLTESAVFYYRRLAESDLLGEERGGVSLAQEVRQVTTLSEDQIPTALQQHDQNNSSSSGESYYLELTLANNRSWLMRTPLADASVCERWAVAIKEQKRRITNNTTNNNNSLSSPDTTTTEEQPSSSSNLSIEQSPTLFATNLPRIHLISVVGTRKFMELNLQRGGNLLTKNRTLANQLNDTSGSVDALSASNNREWVVSHDVKWGTPIQLGVLPQGCACLVALSSGIGSGPVARIGTQALMGSWDSGQPCWVEATVASNASTAFTNEESTPTDKTLLYPTELEVSVVCEVLQDAPSCVNDKHEHSDSAVVNELLASKIANAEEITGIGFLIMCLFVHILHGVDDFHWSVKICLTVGAALAITTCLNGSPRHPSSTKKKKEERRPSAIPDFRFEVTVHRCKMRIEGKDYYYPVHHSA